MARTLNLKALSAALGVDKGQLSKEMKRPGFPFDLIADHKVCDAEEVRAWRAANIKPSMRRTRAVVQTIANQSDVAAPLPAPTGVPAAPVARALTDQERKLASVLADPDAGDVEKAAASYAIACLKVSRGYESDKLGARELDDLKKQSEELRRVRSEFMTLAERRGELIERDVAKAVAGALVHRLLTILVTVENSMPTQFEIWLADKAFIDQGTEQRAQQIRKWFCDQARSLRTTEADAIEALIKNEVEERQ